MKFIGLSGDAGAGKDTAFLLLSDYYTQHDLKVTQLSFAKKLKEVCCLLYGWDLERLKYDAEYKEGNTLDDGTPDPACEMLGMTRREVMQYMGTEAFRQGIHQDHWIIVTKLMLLWGEYDEYDIGIVTDARFLNELKFVRDHDGILIRLNREDEENGSTLTDKTDHASELEWKQWTDWDAVVVNQLNPKKSMQSNMDNFQNTLVRAVDDAWTRLVFKRNIP